MNMSRLACEGCASILWVEKEEIDPETFKILAALVDWNADEHKPKEASDCN